MSTRLRLHEVARVSRIDNLVSLGFGPMWKRLFLTPTLSRGRPSPHRTVVVSRNSLILI